jgi:hypothetical protein
VQSSSICNLELIYKWKPYRDLIGINSKKLSKMVFFLTWAKIVSSRGREKTRDERSLTGCVVAVLFPAILLEEIARTECGPATTESDNSW